jgi:UDP:flavonoid glycosyltransferase YjiC (YdhE family)
VAQCAVVACGGGHGTVCAALLGGKPVLVAPDVTEQGITAHRVAALGAGIMLLIGEEHKSHELVGRLLGEPAFARGAEAFRKNYNLVTEAQTVNAIAARCLQLSGKPTRAGL